MEQHEIEPLVREHAARRGVVVWESFPWGGATVLWPDSDTLEEFLAVFDQLGCTVLYLQDDADAVGFAASGVVHVFASSRLRPQLEPASTDSSDVDADDDDFEPESGLRASMTVTRSWNDPYWDWETSRTLSGELRALVDEIVADPSFDGHRTRTVTHSGLTHLSAEDEESVINVARRLFEDTVGKDLDTQARRIAAKLVDHPHLDPLARGALMREFVAPHVAEDDPRLLDRVSRSLFTLALDSGLVAKSRRENKEIARRVLDSLPPEVRDRVGFATRSNVRRQVLTDYLTEIPEGRRGRVVDELGEIESELLAPSREARYATAVRRMLALGTTKAQISRQLGISTSVMDRIASVHRDDVTFDADDPIVTTLAPEDSALRPRHCRVARRHRALVTDSPGSRP